MLIDTFRTLRTTYPTWLELKAYLTSEEGGNLRVIDDTGNNSPYAMIRIGKQVSAAVAQFRSIVWDKEGHRPVCIAPFKSCEGTPPTGVRLRINEFIDGFMVNTFLCPSTGNLCVATRTQLGGGNTFYGAKTFGQMFDDALAATPLKGRGAIATALAGGGFASFVVQHPDHRVVAKVDRPSLKVVHVGRTEEDGAVHLSLDPMAWPESLRCLAVEAAEKEYATVEAIQDTMTRMSIQEGWRWQGLCYHDDQGHRWRLRSPTYTMLRDLRGGEGAAVDRFLRLRSEGKVGEYLKHYGEDRQSFWGYEAALRASTTSVLSAYADCHKTHKLGFKELPEAFRPAVYILHVKWLQELRPKGFSVRQQNAVEVVNGLRLFEQRRLLEASAYVPSILPPRQRAAAAGAAVAEIQETSEEVVAVTAEEVVAQ